jgi:hypothetical protein
MARIEASVDIQVAKNKDWKTEKLYLYKAVAIIDRENKVDIGLISPASIEAYGKTLETGKMFTEVVTTRLQELRVDKIKIDDDIFFWDTFIDEGLTDIEFG